MAKIIRDAAGTCINIGDWNDLSGENLLPEGAYEDDAEITTGYDGGLYVKGDPRALGGDQ